MVGGVRLVVCGWWCVVGGVWLVVCGWWCVVVGGRWRSLNRWRGTIFKRIS